MIVVIVRRQVLFWLPILVFLLVGAVLTFTAWLAGPAPPPRLGLAAPWPQLVSAIFPGARLGQIVLGEERELVRRLNQGELDYLLELGEPTPGLVSWHLGYLVPAVVVPFFDPRQDLDSAGLARLIHDQPAQILVALELALPGFPWWGQPVQYLPYQEVVESLTMGRGTLGIIPLQERRPAVRVLPMDGVDPRACAAEPSAYPLTRGLHLSRQPKGFFQRLRDWVQHRLKNPVNGLRELARCSAYAQPWAGEISLVAVGDIMLDRDVKKVGLEKGWEYIFAETAPTLRAADLSFANLESPVGDQGHFINMFQAPPEAVEGLAFAGLDVVSLANNHSLDYHHAGLLETMRLLREYGLDWVGAGRDLSEARRAVIREVKGVKVGFLAYTELWFVHAREPISWQATLEEPGVAPAELEMVVEDVQRLRSLVDVLVVSVHWGREYVHEPTEAQKELARAAAAAGADLILGHHPHVLQGLEFYADSVIAYSLGNFVFDLNLPSTWETMVLEFTLSAGGVRDLAIISAYISGVQPRLLQGAHREAVYQRIRHYSLQLAE
ncbi:MAG: CapA family protein [Firmicutes bacterium]|nr:CapA family protein [Bacillota bacterium]